jgi:hypothetical protein
MADLDRRSPAPIVISARGGQILSTAATLKITDEVPRYDPEGMNQSEADLFDPRDRQAQKQASRRRCQGAARW